LRACDREKRKKDGRHGCFVDAEHALDPQYAKEAGVDVENLLVSQPIMASRRWKLPSVVRSNATTFWSWTRLRLSSPSRTDGENGDITWVCRHD